MGKNKKIFVKGFVFDTKDNVATITDNVKKGDLILLSLSGEKLKAKEEIPFAHKIAAREISIGSYIYKYGEKIGQATKLIKMGEHVHTHNISSLRVKKYKERKTDE